MFDLIDTSAVDPHPDDAVADLRDYVVKNPDSPLAKSMAIVLDWIGSPRPRDDESRNRWLRVMRERVYPNLDDRPAGRQIDRDARAYQSSEEWRRHQHAASCPESLIGTRREYLWRALACGK